MEWTRSSYFNDSPRCTRPKQISTISRKESKQCGYALGLLLLALPAACQVVSTPNIAQYPSKEFEEAVHAYILSHPEVVTQAIELMEARSKAAKQQAAKDAIALHQAELFTDPSGGLAKHPTSNDVAVVEFFDYRCGYCRKMQPTVKRLAAGGGVRIIYKQLPILGPESMYASKAALASAKHGVFEAFHEALMNSTSPLTAETVDRIALDMRLDVSQLKIDMESPETSATISRTVALAESLAIEATPTFVVGKEISAGALSEQSLQSLIESERNKSKLTLAASGNGSH
jgi:protein-disulfide isomerase